MVISRGLKNAATSRLRPMARPTGMAARRASAKPSPMRRSESRMLSTDPRSPRIAGSSRKAWCAGGRPLMSKIRAAISQSASSPQQASSGGSPGTAARRTLMTLSFPRSGATARSQWGDDGASSAFLRAVQQSLDVDDQGLVAPVEQQLGTAARARKRDVYGGFDAARRARQHDDAVGEEYRLLDAVRDEQHGLAVTLPDVEQLVL